MSTTPTIHQTRALAEVVIVDRRYSPQFWDADRSVPSRLRQAAIKWQPVQCVIHVGEQPIHFIAFGNLEGALAALDQHFGPEVASKASIDRILFAQNRVLLDVLPEQPADAVDQFVFITIFNFARMNLGCGFDAIQGGQKLAKMREMSYEALREAAVLSPDYSAYVAALAACSKPVGH